MISIIIPVYNVKNYLEDCIESIINQTYRNFEVILVDDGSTDGSEKICDYYANLDKRINCIHIKNAGVSNARNVGLSNAKGDYIAFCDSDDRYSINFLLEMFKAIEKTKADIVICSYYYSNSEINKPVKQGQKSGFISREELFEKIFVNNEIGGFVWNKIFKKSIIDNIRFDTNLEICEDTDFICSVTQKNSTLYYLSEPLYFYTIRDNSAINNVKSLFNIQGQSKYVEAYKKILKSYRLTQLEKSYIYSAIFLSSSSVKCNYMIKGGKNALIISNLNSNCLDNLWYLIINKKISLKRKIISILNWLFNFRKIKRIIQRILE